MSLPDLEAVLAIEEASFTQSWSRHSFQSELERNRLARYLVARRHGRLVGYGGIWIVLDEAHLTTLAVEKGFRREGIGSALLCALLDQAVEAGACRMTLEVRPSNLAARHLYESFGFTVRGVRKKYYLNEDALFMIKEDLDGSLSAGNSPAYPLEEKG